jgi:branched-chain amino acid transport system permease protein
MEKTDTGRAIRAVSQDRDAALLMGVNDTNIFLTAMFLSGFVAGAAGNVVAILYSFTPNSGPTYMGWSFVISVLAGLGTIQGVLIAGIIIGIVRSLTTFVSSELFSVSGIEQAIGFILMILVILIRPLGLFGRRSE